MKKIAFFLACAMTFSLFSCAKIELTETEEETKSKENETMELTESKTEILTFGDDTRERTDTEDPHVLVDFNSEFLDKLYAGTTAYYGDLHVHSNSGTPSNGKKTSDGKTPLAEFTKGMDKVGVDFAAIVDHKQIRHTILPEFDNNRMLIGTEPANFFPERPSSKNSVGLESIHYCMIFRTNDDFMTVMEKFPEFKYTILEKDNPKAGYFPSYPHFSRSRLTELAKFINSIGGIFVYAHPAGTEYDCADTNNAFFGDYTYFEVLNTDKSYPASIVPSNYKAWVKHLNAGHRLYVSGGSDTHSAVKNDCVSTFYTTKKNNIAFFDTMKKGNYTAGCLGMQMSIGDVPMGGETTFEKGKVLCLRTDDAFENFNKSHKFRLQIVSDKGVAFSVDDFDMTKPFCCALEIEDRMYYRAEVIDLTLKEPVALSNPIWLNK